MAANVIWYGDRIFDLVEKSIVSGLTEWALTTETAAKSSLHPGRGVVTGTYRRSIHSAPTGYNFSGDNVKPSGKSPDRSGKGGGANRKGDNISIVIGSGMAYARKLEDLYSVITVAFERTSGSLLGILERHAIKNGLTPD